MLFLNEWTHHSWSFIAFQLAVKEGAHRNELLNTPTLPDTNTTSTFVSVPLLFEWNIVTMYWPTNQAQITNSPKSYMCIMSKYFTGTICLIISLSIHVAKYFLISEDGACFQCNITIRNFFIIHMLYNLTLCHVSFKNECRLLQVWFLDNPEFHTGIPFPVCVEKECDTHCHIR